MIQSAITNHRMHCDHEFNGKCESSDVEKHYNKRLFAEIIHINNQSNELNVKTDDLNKSYIEILNKL